MSKKIENILALIEIAENNLRNAKELLTVIIEDKGGAVGTTISPKLGSTISSSKMAIEEHNAIEVIEGYFDGESMIGDNGQSYTVPQNYASKTQLVIGDRMKWMLTPDREVYKLIAQAERERVIGTFSMDGDNYIVITEQFKKPIKVLKASSTFAMKNLGLEFGDEVVVIIPKNSTPVWGAFSSVVKSLSESEKNMILSSNIPNNKKSKKEVLVDNISDNPLQMIKTDEKIDLSDLDYF